MIFLASCFVLFHFTVLANCYSGDKVEAFTIAKKDAQLRFAELLKQVISINEDRFNAMKELTRLQEQRASGNFLRAKNDETADVGQRTSPIVLILSGQNLSSNLLSKLKRMYKQDSKQIKRYSSSSDSSSESSVELTTGNLEKLVQCTRRNEIFCVKSARKICKRSCYTTYKDTCLRFRCKRRFKKEAKRNCKITCRKEFDKGKYEDSGSD